MDTMIGRKIQDGVHLNARNFPVVAEGYEPNILSRDYFNLLHKGSAIIEPILVLRGIRTIVSGLLEQKQPAQIDADFVSKAYLLFDERGLRGQRSLDMRPGRRVDEHREDTIRRGWLLLIAEDTLGVVSIIDARRSPRKKVDMGVSHHRLRAHELFTRAGDNEGMYVNATQELYCDRMRGLRGAVHAPVWLGRAAFAADKVSEGVIKDYTPARFHTISSRSVAEQVFLSNVFSHDGARVVR